MLDVGAISRFHAAQLALLAATYNKAWQHGVASYKPDRDPVTPLPADLGHPQVVAAVGLGTVAALLHRRQQIYVPPPAPIVSYRDRALTPAVNGMNHMAGELQQVIADAKQVQAAEDAIRAGTIQPEDLTSYALALAAREWVEKNEWRLDAGESTAWAGEQDGYSQAADVDGQLLEWLDEGDDHVCDDCKELAALPPMPLGEWPTTPGAGDTECNVGCFVPSVAVEGDFLAGTKARYRGQMLELQTASGARVTLTPNHPVATPEGFIAAGKLRNGQHLLRHIGGETAVTAIGALSPAQHHNHEPLTIEQVFCALQKLGRSRRVTPRSHDLHGDARWVDGEIEVVATHGVLIRDRQARSRQHHHQIDLKQAVALGLTSRSIAGQKLTIPNLASTCCCPGCGKLPFRRRSIHRDPLHALRVGSSSQRNARLLQPAGHAPSVDLQLISQLLDRRSSQIIPDKLVHVRLLPEWEGHVYDLQSTTGWLLADSIVCSNCRCVLQVSDVQLEPGGELPTLSDEEEALISRVAESREPALALA